MPAPLANTNPSPRFAGVELLPDTAGAAPFANGQNAVAIAVNANSTETITSVAVYVESLTARSGIVCDVYDLATLTGRPPPTERDTFLVPVQDLELVPCNWVTETPNQRGGPSGTIPGCSGVTNTTALWSHINTDGGHWLGAPPGTYIAPQGGALGQDWTVSDEYICRMALPGGANPSFVGWRTARFFPLAWVEAHCVGNSTTGAMGVQVNQHIGSASPFLYAAQIFPCGPSYALYQPVEVGYALGIDWLSLDHVTAPGSVRADQIAQGAFGINLNHESGTVAKVLFSFSCQIVSWPEDRVAFGEIAPGQVQLGWNNIPVVIPGSGGQWSKTSGHTYLVVVRSGYGNGIANLRYLSGPETPPGKLQDRSAQFLPKSNGVVGGIGSPGRRSFAVLLGRVDGQWSADGQPFTHADTNTPTVLADEIHSGNSAAQELTPSTSGSYGFVQLMVRAASSTTTVPLTITLTDAGNSALSGATMQITAADLQNDLTTSFQIVRKTLGAAATLNAGTLYHLQFDCAAPAGQGWVVQVLRSNWLAPAGLAAPNLGNTVLNMGGVRYPNAAMAASIGTVPPTPAGLAATPFESPTFNSRTIPPEMQLTWTPTSLGADFNAYLIKRGGVPITELPVEATNTFFDTEARLGIAESYTIAVRRADGSISPDSAPSTATVAPLSCRYTFTSNQAPGLGVMFNDDAPRTFGDVRSTNVKIVDLWGNAGAVEFVDDQWRGVTFDLNLLVANMPPSAPSDPPVASSLGAFQYLRALLDSDLPYVCVRDSFGNRWFASVRAQDYVWDATKGTYISKTRVHELTPRPFKATVAWRT